MRILINAHGNERVKYIDNGDWVDLKCAEDVEMKAGEYREISLGVSMQLPINCEAHVLPRSSTFKRYGIIMANGMGVIDNSYNGDGDVWKFPAIAMRDTRIEKGTRIAQFRTFYKMQDVDIEHVESLGNDDRGGFGSTGV